MEYSHYPEVPCDTDNTQLNTNVVRIALQEHTSHSIMGEKLDYTHKVLTCLGLFVKLNDANDVNDVNYVNNVYYINYVNCVLCILYGTTMRHYVGEGPTNLL